jgi:hypothetical protein
LANKKFSELVEKKKRQDLAAAKASTGTKNNKLNFSCINEMAMWLELEKYQKK